MKIKKEDKVLITKGKDRGRTGKVLKTNPGDNTVIVEDANIAIKHIRPQKKNEEGQRVKVPAPLDASNVKLVCPKCSEPTRVGFKRQGGEKKRYCKKCNQILS